MKKGLRKNPHSQIAIILKIYIFSRSFTFRDTSSTLEKQPEIYQRSSCWLCKFWFGIWLWKMMLIGICYSDNYIFCSPYSYLSCPSSSCAGWASFILRSVLSVEPSVCWAYKWERKIIPSKNLKANWKTKVAAGKILCAVLAL